MTTTVTGSAGAAFANGLYQMLAADAILVAMVSDIASSMRRDQRVPFPYVVISGRKEWGNRDAGAMQREGAKAIVPIDVFSAADDRAEVDAILSRIRIVLSRTDVLPVTLPGFTLYAGSTFCDEEQVYPEPDPDIPDRMLFHGAQQWSGLLEESL